MSQSDVVQDASSVNTTSSQPDPAFSVTPEGIQFDLHYTDIAIRDAWATLKADASLPADLRVQIDALPADSDVGQILAFLDAHQDVPAVANARDSLLDDPMFTQSVSTLRANDWGLDVTGRTVVTPDDSVHAGGTKETHYGVDADGKVYIAAEELADADGRVSQITYFDPDGTVNRTTTNTYDANGRPATTATTWADTGTTRIETYSYDAAGQETGSTASITRRFGLDGQVQETGFYTYDADQQQISGTERGFAGDGKLLFEVEMAPDGSPAKVIRFEAGVLDAASLETFHALIQDARADGNTAFLDHPGVRQLGALLDLGQAMGLGYADLKQVDISNLGGAFLGETRLVDVLHDPAGLAAGSYDETGLAALKANFQTAVSAPAPNEPPLTYSWTETTSQNINGQWLVTSEVSYTRVLTPDLDPGNLPTEKEGAVSFSVRTDYDSNGRVISRVSSFAALHTGGGRDYYLGDQRAFTITPEGTFTLPEGATWTPERIELLGTVLQDFRLGNDPYLTLNVPGSEKIQALGGLLEQAALFGIGPQDYVAFDPNSLFDPNSPHAPEITRERYIQFLESMRSVDGVDQAALETLITDVGAKPDLKTISLLDVLSVPANVLTLGAFDDAVTVSKVLFDISKAAGGSVLGRPVAEVGPDLLNDLSRTFGLTGDVTKSVKALKVLGPVVGVLFLAWDLYEGITAFNRHKAEGRSDLTLAYDVFMAMGGGPGGAITAAIHRKREHNGSPEEVATAFFAGLFGAYDPDNPEQTGELLAASFLQMGMIIEKFWQDPVGTYQDGVRAFTGLIWGIANMKNDQ